MSFRSPQLTLVAFPLNQHIACRGGICGMVGADAEVLRAEGLGLGPRGRGQRYPLEFRRRAVIAAGACAVSA
jgi:hypothetical protein